MVVSAVKSPPVPILNAALVLSAFGRWPTFHDAEVHRVVLDRGGSGGQPSITLVLHAFDTDGTVDEKGYYRITTSVLITLRLMDIVESALQDLGQQNVLSSLQFEAADRGQIRVMLGPCHGLSGSIVCGQVLVESLVPWRSPSEDAPSVSPPLG